MPFVNRATGQLFPSAESKSDVEERKKSAARKEEKTCLSSIRDDSMNREDQNKNVFKNRVFFPAIDNRQLCVRGN